MPGSPTRIWRWRWKRRRGRFLVEELGRIGADVPLAEPAEASWMRGPKCSVSTLQASYPPQRDPYGFNRDRVAVRKLLHLLSER